MRYVTRLGRDFEGQAGQCKAVLPPWEARATRMGMLHTAAWARVQVVGAEHVQAHGECRSALLCAAAAALASTGSSGSGSLAFCAIVEKRGLKVRRVTAFLTRPSRVARSAASSAKSCTPVYANAFVRGGSSQGVASNCRSSSASVSSSAGSACGRRGRGWVLLELSLRPEQASLGQQATPLQDRLRCPRQCHVRRHCGMAGTGGCSMEQAERHTREDRRACCSRPLPSCHRHSCWSMRTRAQCGREVPHTG